MKEFSQPPEIVILHSAGTQDYDLHHPDFDSWTGARVTHEHVNVNGWDDNGYHYFIRRSGIIDLCRPEKYIGSHCFGKNSKSLGMCYAGTMKPTLMQIQSILTLASAIRKRFGLGPEDWFAHHDFTDKKICPGFGIELIRELLREDQKQHG